MCNTLKFWIAWLGPNHLCCQWYASDVCGVQSSSAGNGGGREAGGWKKLSSYRASERCTYRNDWCLFRRWRETSPCWLPKLWQFFTQHLCLALMCLVSLCPQRIPLSYISLLFSTLPHRETSQLSGKIHVLDAEVLSIWDFKCLSSFFWERGWDPGSSASWKEQATLGTMDQWSDSLQSNCSLSLSLPWICLVSSYLAWEWTLPLTLVHLPYNLLYRAGSAFDLCQPRTRVLPFPLTLHHLCSPELQGCFLNYSPSWLPTYSVLMMSCKGQGKLTLPCSLILCPWHWKLLTSKGHGWVNRCACRSPAKEQVHNFAVLMSGGRETAGRGGIAGT